MPSAIDPGRPRVVAFHLPQFHPIPENDAWWGKGFTEWTNVTRARPLFAGHFQPRLPADLGFYDLRLPEALRAQADLAREHGIGGFCYHYYWFKGRRLLERPIDRMLASGEPDFPFCLCWANENWTRRWDGLDQEILVRQEHDAASDVAFLHGVLPFFRDRRYLRVGDRPLLVVYHVDLFPDPAATVQRWHDEARRLGEPAPYLVAAESFPGAARIAVAAGFDATCEFPPLGAGAATLPRERWPAFAQPFSGLLLDYERLVALSLAAGEPPHRRFRAVTLNWDNTARRKSAAHVMTGFSLAAYHRWLAGALARCRASAPEGERFVFVNAWNEWGEGTYLEPDQLYGLGYLEATRAAIEGVPLPAHLSAAGAGLAPALSPRAAALAAAPTAGSAETTGAPAVAAGAPRPSRHRIAVVALVGNEADVVEAFVRENLRFADVLLVADRASLDGTQAILAALVAEGLPLVVERIDDTTFDETEVVDRLLRTALDRHGADWILPLDADEIVDAVDRAALDDALVGLGGQHGALAWVTHAPTALDDPGEAHPLRRLAHRYAYPTPEREQNPFVWKLVVNAALFAPYLDRYELEPGNHRIVFRGTREPSAQPVQPLAGARLRHFPVRSAEQLALEVAIAQASLAASDRDRTGGPWSPIRRSLLEQRCDVALLQSACRHYLDTGRVSPEQAAEVPLVRDPLAARCTLTLDARRIGAAQTLMRWIGRRLPGEGSAAR